MGDSPQSITDLTMFNAELINTHKKMKFFFYILIFFRAKKKGRWERMPISLHGISTPVLQEGDSLYKSLMSGIEANGLALAEGDVLVLSSKVVSMLEVRGFPGDLWPRRVGGARLTTSRRSLRLPSFCPRKAECQKNWRRPFARTRTRSSGGCPTASRRSKMGSSSATPESIAAMRI